MPTPWPRALPGIHGLYATIAALLAYALFGPSRILVLGPDSSLAALILAVVLPLSAGDPARAVALAGAMAIVVGLICIGAGLARLGFVTELLSKPIRYGYMNGIALAVIVSQLPKLCGISIRWRRPAGAGRGLRAGAVGRAAERRRPSPWARARWLLILVLKRWPRVPGMLIAIGAGHGRWWPPSTWTRRHGVAVLGALPQGLPALSLPWIGLADLLPVLGGALAVALVAFADTSVLSRSYAQRQRSAVDPNQEMVALGAANLAVGLFQGFPISSSSSRTPVAEAAGARSQMTGVVGALAVAALLLLAPDLLQRLPCSALAAVVIASVIGLIEWRDLQRIRRIQAWEFWLSIGCSAGVLLLGAIQGIVLAIVVVGDRVPVGRLAAAFGGAGPGGRRRRLPRRAAPPRGAAHRRAGAVALGRAAVLCQCRMVRARGARHHGRRRPRRCKLAGGGGRAGDQRRRDRRRHAARAGRSRCRSRASSCASPR